jgi:hypothetical protein
MDEYKVFWEGICSMCSNYMTGIQQQQHVPAEDESHRMYGFLEKGSDESIQSNSCSNNSNNRKNSSGSNTKPSSFESFGSPGSDFWDLN